MTGLASLAGVVALIVGGLFGAYEYADRKEMQRATETMAMIEIWETRGAQQAYLDLSRALEKHLSDTPAEDRNDPDNALTLRDNIARRAMRDHPGAYDKVVYFFSRLSLCVQASLCSEPVARTFFGDSLHSFKSWFEDEKARRRQWTPAHGRELDVLSVRFQGPE
ncbi:hypothetical protein SAMN04488093_10115 [Tropicibacter naphthalenivorans]|uniref:DUF4760 domain-containing protein n=2 Tax=Tropicibacter naphthalenivorans TaxID=441103 RepID=A0A0P1G3N4_9RHOB|nr:hypothetical protein TRN7648_00867 [Tropicibacter naphthalenivorans]SMC39046.1 hypothetical protein SAMN04488093_10115 [Tropicibacter naphthalenivorans]